MNGCEALGVTTLKDTIGLLQQDLFPKARQLSISTVSYMEIVFSHSRIAQEEKDFLKNGVKWLGEAAYKKYQARYTQLSKMHRIALLEEVAQTQWGKSFLDSILRYTLEAALGDPIYGGNNNQAGWKWLGFEAPNPQTKKAYL